MSEAKSHGARVDLSCAILGTEAYVDVTGTRIRYFRAGEGPPVVLLHGLGEAALIWCRNVDVMVRRFDVIVPDLPGHGLSSSPTWRYSLANGTQWLLEFMDTLGVDQAGLVGNSLGGLLAASAALNAPARVRSLVLEDSAGLGKEVAAILRLMSVPVVGEIIARPTLASMRRLMRLLLFDPSVASEGFLEALHRERARPGNKAALLRVLRAGVTVFGVKGSVMLAERLPELDVPTLLVWGREDRVFPVAHAERAVAMMPRASLHVFDRCGHWPHFEYSAAFNELVLRFLSNVT